MSALSIVSEIQRNVVMSSRFTGLRARYIRLTFDKEGDLIENKCVILSISPQNIYGVADKRREEFDARITVFWAKTDELKFDGEPFLPKEGDTIEYKLNGILHQFVVTVLHDVKIQSSMGTQASFAYEDGLHSIIKIMTVKQK